MNTFADNYRITFYLNDKHVITAEISTYLGLIDVAIQKYAKTENIIYDRYTSEYIGTES